MDAQLSPSAVIHNESYIQPNQLLIQLSFSWILDSILAFSIQMSIGSSNHSHVITKVAIISFVLINKDLYHI
jgi:hypothetical protein